MELSETEPWDRCNGRVCQAMPSTSHALLAATKAKAAEINKLGLYNGGMNLWARTEDASRGFRWLLTKLCL